MGKKRVYNHDQLARINEIKRSLCWTLQRVHARTQQTQGDFARRLGTTQSTLSAVFNHNYERVTIDRLVTYLVIAESDVMAVIE